MRDRMMLLAILLLAIFLGKGYGSPTAEPAGESWKTIVIPSADAVTIPPPPANNSTATVEELNELHFLQAARTPDDLERIRNWEFGVAVRWNEIARGLVIKYRTPPPMASRVYALVSVAQYDAVLAARAGEDRYRRPAPAVLDPAIMPLVGASGDAVYPCEQAAIAAASASVLAYLYPAETANLDQLAQDTGESRLWAGANYRSDVTAGAGVGEQVAALVVARAKTDGADAAWTGIVPEGPGYWYSSATPPLPPLLPAWGQVRPWLVPSISALRPSPPPAFGSPEFLDNLHQVRMISDSRTPEQIAIAHFWDDGAGTVTPAGHWNQIACDLILQYRLDELHAARTLALLNMAEMDAGICCWDAKYTYWLIRPSQADPGITQVLALPNFPSYPSGHATFSGAAAVVLGAFFPKKQSRLDGMAEEAAMSRVYAGIHYPFDTTEGLRSGQAIGRLAVAWGQLDEEN